MSARGVDLLVRGGRVVTATDDFEAAVAINAGRIVAIAPEGVLPPADRVIDATGKIVFPGLIDCHLHVGPEYDDWKTSALAAARTGLTSIVPFVTCGEGEAITVDTPAPLLMQPGKGRLLSTLQRSGQPRHIGECIVPHG